MDFVNDIIPISELKKQFPKIIEKLKKARTPFLITQNGKSAAFLIDVQEYQEQMRRLKLLEGIIQAEKDIREGRIHTQQEVETLFRSWQESK